MIRRVGNTVAEGAYLGGQLFLRRVSLHAGNRVGGKNFVIFHIVDHDGLFGDEVAHGETFRFCQREEVRELHASGLPLRRGVFPGAVAAEPESLLLLRPAQVAILGILLVVGQIEPAAVEQFYLCGQSSRKVDILVAVHADRPALGVRRGRIAVRLVPDNEFHCK